MLQLKKGLRLETLGRPFKEALLVAAQIGADAVEINARTDLRPAELSRTGARHLLKMLSDLNLKVCSVHYPTRRGFENTDQLEQRVEGTRSAMKLAFELGCSIVVNHIGKVPEDQKSAEWNTMHQALTDLGMHSHRAGAWLAAGTGDQPVERLKSMIAALPPMSIGVDFDPGDLLINGISPTDAMKQLGEHVMSFRLRDAVRDLKLGRGVEVQLGRGSVDWPQLLGELEQQQYSGYLIVDRTANSDEVVTQSAESLEYLTNLFT